MPSGQKSGSGLQPIAKMHQSCYVALFTVFRSGYTDMLRFSYFLNMALRWPFLYLADKSKNYQLSIIGSL